MTRNRESVILTNALKAGTNIGTALALLHDDQHPGVHNALIVAEEIRQQWHQRDGRTAA